tara:strand:+ start:1440 stop:2579 length:1140 start_codon:yes stop_codon:yes gene_type:complete
MSGLLDKANKTAAEKTEVVPDEIASEESLQLDSKITTGLQIAGVLSLLVSMFLLVQNGWLYATLSDYIIAFFLMLIGWTLFNSSDYLQQELSKAKIALTALGFAGLFIATIVGTIFMNAGGAVTIASVELDGEKDEIDLSFFGPSGTAYTVEVFVDGSVQYSHDGEINIDRGSHSISLDEFWSGNSMNMNDMSKVDYEIKVTSDSGEDSVKFNDIMNREVDTGFVRITEVFDTNSNGEKTYTGITVEMIIGMGDPSAEYGFANNFFTGTTPKTIASDWSATLVVKMGGNVEYQYSTINANEGIVNGIGEFFGGWVVMPGTNAGDLARSDFYDSDGCYTFEVQIVNDLGETYTDTSSQIEFFWDDNEISNDDEDQPAEAC